MSAAGMATSHRQSSTISFVPREHGATAMLLIPFLSAAILSREWRWAEVAVLVAAVCSMAAKDPLVVLARQRWVWKRHHPETDAAKNWLLVEGFIVAGCVLVLAASWPWWTLALAGAVVAGFSALTVVVSVKNRQRSTGFQIASAIVLSSTALVTSLSATGDVQPWAWRLWVLCAMQAAAGIFVVHARLDARIAARKQKPERGCRLTPALLSTLVLLGISPLALITHQTWIAAALALAGAGYLYELNRQQDVVSLQMPLTRVGLQTMSLSIAYAAMVIAGLW